MSNISQITVSTAMTADPTPKPSIWLNHLTKEYLESPELHQMILEKKLNGISPNLDALYNSLYNQKEYNNLIKRRIDSNSSANNILTAIFYDLARRACKKFDGLYKDSLGAGGFVCMPLSPDVALDTRSTIKQASYFWQHVDHRNLMISIPSTKQGIQAIGQLLVSGINVNATMIYSLKRYRQSAEAYVTALEELARQGKRIDQLASIASIKLDSIDSILGPALRKVVAGNKREKAIITPLLGCLGKATAILVGKAYNELFGSARFQALEVMGANPQRIIWVCDRANSCTPDISPDFSSFFNIQPHFQVPEISDFKASKVAGKLAFPDVDRANMQLQLANQLLGFSYTDLLKKMENDILSVFTTSYKKLIDFIDAQRISNSLTHSYLQQDSK